MLSTESYRTQHNAVLVRKMRFSRGKRGLQTLLRCAVSLCLAYHLRCCAPVETPPHHHTTKRQHCLSAAQQMPCAFTQNDNTCNMCTEWPLCPTAARALWLRRRPRVGGSRRRRQRCIAHGRLHRGRHGRGRCNYRADGSDGQIDTAEHCWKVAPHCWEIDKAKHCRLECTEDMESCSACVRHAPTA